MCVCLPSSLPFVHSLCHITLTATNDHNHLRYIYMCNKWIFSWFVTHCMLQQHARVGKWRFCMIRGRARMLNVNWYVYLPVMLWLYRSFGNDIFRGAFFGVWCICMGTECRMSQANFVLNSSIRDKNKWCDKIQPGKWLFAKEKVMKNQHRLLNWSYCLRFRQWHHHRVCESLVWIWF